MEELTGIKKVLMEYIKQETTKTGTRVGYLGMARQGLDHQPQESKQQRGPHS